MVTSLVAASARLEIDCDASGWCDATLDANGRHRLGSETRNVLVDRLVRALRNELSGPSSGELEGVSVVWVLSLSERHASIYAAHRDGMRNLYFQDAEGKLIARLALGTEEREEWISILERTAPR